MPPGYAGPETPLEAGREAFVSLNREEVEDVMETLAVLGQFFVGVGLLLVGCAAIWFVSVYSEKKE